MRSFLTALLLLSSPALAEEACPPVPRVYHAPFRCKPGLERIQCGGQTRCLRPDQCPAHRSPPAVAPVPAPVPLRPAPVPPPAMRAVPTIPAPAAPVAPPTPPSAWHVGPYFQLGSGIREPRDRFTHAYSTPGNGGMIEWDVGFHAHYLPARLGGRIYYAGNYGLGSQLELYVLQGQGLELHLDAGVLLYDAGSGNWGSRHNYASVIDVERSVDLQYGLGAELPVGKGFVLTLDARASQPLTRQSVASWTPEAGNVATNALHQFHLLGGLMLRM